MRANRRIGFDGRYINDQYHGIGRYAFRLLEALVKLDPASTYIIFRGKAPNSRFDWQRLATRGKIEFRDGPWPLYWPQEQIVWPALLMRADLDLFHSPYFVAPLLKVYGRAPLPVIITVHDLIFDRYPQYMPRRITYPYYSWLMDKSIRRSNFIVVVSNATVRDLKAHYHTPEHCIQVIPEGVDPSFQPLDQKEMLNTIRQRYQLYHPFILNVGARRPHKNLSLLVEAFHEISQKSEYEIIFAGPGDPRFPDSAKHMVNQYQLSHRIRFLDWVPEKDLPALYSMADMVVLPSLIEGFGLPALEAMACGTAVIAADNSSYPEVIGDAGLLVNPWSVRQLAEKMQHLIENPTQRQSLGNAGRRMAAKFSWEHSAEAILQVYEKVLA